MKNTKLIILALVITLILVGIVFISHLKQGEEKVIKIGYVPISASLPLFVAIEKGYFEEAGLNVSAEKFSDSNLIMQSLISGSLDATSNIAYSTLFPLESQQPNNFIIYSGVSDSEKNFANSILIKKDSNISSISDLKGKKIVTREGLGMKVYTSLVLEKFNISLNEVQLVQVNPSLLVQTFSSPDIDAIYDTEPTITIILEKGLGRVLVDNPRGKYILNPFPTAGAVFSTKFLRENPKIAKKINDATDKAIDFIRQNPREAKILMTKYIPLDVNISIKSNLYEYEKLEDIDKSNVQKLADILLENKVIDNNVNVTSMFVSKFGG